MIGVTKGYTRTLILRQSPYNPSGAAAEAVSRLHIGCGTRGPAILTAIGGAAPSLWVQCKTIIDSQT